MNYKIIACKVLWRELSLITASSPDYCDVTYLKQGLHESPDRLREAIQSEIEAVESGEDIHTNQTTFDAILLCYALCAGSVEGLRASKHTLVVPRAHDCVTLLLGSAERYHDYFFDNKGTFWNSIGWSECGYLPDEDLHERRYAAFAAKRGGAMADRLIEADERWKKNYSKL